MHLTARRLRRDDHGVTLVELLVAIAVLGIIIAPLTSALIGFFRNVNATNNRFAESDDAEIATAYFAQDVQSIGVRDWSAAPYPLIQSVETNAPATGGLYPCGSGSTPNAVIRLAWDDPTSATGRQRVVVAYVVMTAGGEQQLHRLRCVGGSTTPSVDLVVTHNVYSVSGPVLTGPAAIPVAIAVTVNVKAPTNTGAPLAVTLYGQRRQT
jgi:prepilin-type N-terminal cleavage/methylation domain-containing protein